MKNTTDEALIALMRNLIFEKIRDFDFDCKTFTEVQLHNFNQNISMNQHAAFML